MGYTQLLIRNRKIWLNDMLREESDILTDEDGDEYVMILEEGGFKKAYLPEDLTEWYIKNWHKTVEGKEIINEANLITQHN